MLNLQSAGLYHLALGAQAQSRNWGQGWYPSQLMGPKSGPDAASRAADTIWQEQKVGYHWSLLPKIINLLGMQQKPSDIISVGLYMVMNYTISSKS